MCDDEAGGFSSGGSWREAFEEVRVVVVVEVVVGVGSSSAESGSSCSGT